MKVNFIYSDADCDRSAECLKIIEKIKQKEDGRIIMIVPDQFSYTAEKLFSRHFGGTGLNGIEVMTFSQMAKRYLSRARRQYLTPAGKYILMQKVLFSLSKEDNIYSGSMEKSGFVESIFKTVAEMKRYMITPGILRDAAKKLGEGILKEKLLSVACIYEEYEKANGGRFCDSEEDLFALLDVLSAEKIFAGAYVFIDEFSDFLPVHYKVIEAIMAQCAGMYITLPQGFGEPELDAIPKTARARIENNARKMGYDVGEISVKNDLLRPRSDEIAVLRKYIAKRPVKMRYEKKTNDIELYTASDPFSEVRFAARRIRSLVDDEGMRYSDISLICGNPEAYIHTIGAVFEDYNIPYFTDTKLAITSHPIVLTIHALFDIIEENWSYDAVFRYLKSGYIYEKTENGIKPFSPEDIDILENYVLKYGIRGKKKWLADDWKYRQKTIGEAVDGVDINDEADEESERLNAIRKRVVKPVYDFTEKIKGRSTVREMTSALFSFMEDIGLYEGIKHEIERFAETGRVNEADRFSKVWNMLIGVMDQLVVTVGEEKCAKEKFSALLKAGLSACMIDIIPSSQDSVTVTSPDSARQKSVSALIIIGAVRGDIPRENISEGMFSDKERAEFSDSLAEDDLEMGNDTITLKNAARFRFLSALFNTRKKLSVSFPMNNASGEAQVPARIINDIGKIFPNVKKYDDLSLKDTDRLVYSKKDAFDYLLENRHNPYDRGINELYSRLMKYDKDGKMKKLIDVADNYKKDQGRISPESAAELYKTLRAYSVSRLGEYAQCPFLYFVKNGLGAKDQEVWQIHSFDLGTLMHYAVKEYCQAVGKGASSAEDIRRSWICLTDGKSDKIIDEVMKRIEKNVLSVVWRDEGKIRYLMMRMAKTLKRSAAVIRESLSKGEYSAVEFEKVFNIKLDGIGIKGMIDRIDLADGNGRRKTGLRVIDYKSGKKDFSVISISDMTDIQLVVYAFAAMELYDASGIRFADPKMPARITGIMYNKLRDDFVEVGNDEENTPNTITKEMKLGGIVIVDENKDAAEDAKDTEKYDLEDIFMMDRDFSNSRKSSFLPVSITSKDMFAKGSAVISAEKFDKIIKYVKNGIKETDKAIRGGDVMIMPYRGKGKNACEFCDMSEICMFDEDRDRIRELCETEEEAWEKIEKSINK